MQHADSAGAQTGACGPPPHNRIGEATYRSLFAAGQDSIVLLDRQTGRILEVNDAACRLYGHSRDEMLRLAVSDISTEPELSRASTRDGVEYIPLRYHRKSDGTSFPVEITANFVQLEGRDVVIGTIRDISARLAAEQALRVSEAKYRVLFDTIPTGVTLADEDGHIVDANPAASRILGLTPDQQARREIDGVEWSVVRPDGSPMPPDEFASVRALKEGRTVSDVEMGVTRGSGDIAWISVSAAPVPGQGVVITYEDITERRRLAEEKAATELRVQVEKEESLARMAGAVAHHFNNLLGAIMGNVELAAGSIPEGTDAAQLLAQAMAAAHRAAEVSGMMLTYLGRARGNREPVDLARMCGTALPALRASLPAGITLDVSLADSGPTVFGNESLLRQCLANLVANACDALGATSGTIRINVRVASGAESRLGRQYPPEWKGEGESYAVIEVIDTGCGIGEAEMEKLFDPFFTTKLLGRGLGLAVVLGAVRAHGGVIRVASHPGNGSAFTVLLPLSDEAVPRAEQRRAELPPVAPGGTVLLVEDETAVRNVARAMLKRLGFSVLEARNGMEAVEVFREHRDSIRCVISDLGMPQLDGWGTLAAVRQIAPGVPVILTSGFDTVHAMVGDHPEWPQAFLQKPFVLAQLRETITSVLAGTAAPVHEPS